ncbi:MAG: hypothetical protein GY756_16425 [bacterium]|nr:hypothetical protein [bacterium]
MIKLFVGNSGAAGDSFAANTPGCCNSQCQLTRKYYSNSIPVMNVLIFSVLW